MNLVWLWILISALGLLLTAYLAHDSWRDLRTLRKAGVANGRRALARIWFAVDVILGIAHLAFLGLGLTLLDHDLPLSFSALIFIYGNLSMIAVSALNATLRHLLYRTRDGEPSIPKPDGDA